MLLRTDQLKVTFYVSTFYVSTLEENKTLPPQNHHANTIGERAHSTVDELGFLSCLEYYMSLVYA